MYVGILRAKAAGRTKQRQQGQAIIIVALSLVMLVGLVGLAADGGHAFVDRRALQSGSDVSSEAGTSLLAFDFHQPPAGSFKSDTQVLAAVTAQVNSSLSSGNQAANFPGGSGAGAGGCDTTNALADGTNVGQIAGGLTASCAWYVDGSDPSTPTTQKKLLLWPAGFTHAGHAVQVGQVASGGGGLLPPVCPSTIALWGTHCTDGTSVLAYYTHPTYFMRAIGQPTAAERAVATSIFAPITTVTGGFAHYAVWAFCSVTDATLNPGDSPTDVDTAHPDNPPDVPDLDPSGSNEQEVDNADIVVIRDNSWASLAPACNLANTNSNNFKGFFHAPVTATPATGSIPPPPPFCHPPNGSCAPGSIQCSSTTYPTPPAGVAEGDYFCAQGGNQIGDQTLDIALLQNAWDTCVTHTAPCVPLLLPVIDFLDEQNASTFAFHIKSWIAGVPTQNPATYNSNTTVTVRVVDLVAHRAGWCPTPPCQTPGPNAPVSINLVQ